jgi:glycosyltransferase involved in cell wall biosynthesis
VLQVYFLDSAYVGVPLARLCGVPRVVRVRNNLGYWLTGPHRGLGRLLKYGLDATLTNSEPGRSAILRAEGGGAGSVVVLENGVDLDRFKARRPPDTGRPSLVRIGVVANLRPVKQLDLFVRAAALIAPRYPRCVFEVAGEGPERGRLEALAGALGLGDRFRLHGAVADVPAFLERLDVAVLCSKSEGMSNALLEYMAAGRAVVATCVGANPELLRGGECGLLVPAGDVAALADGLRKLMDDPELAARLGANARQSVRENYSRDAMRRRFEAFYEELCRPRRKKPELAVA